MGFAMRFLKMAKVVKKVNKMFCVLKKSQHLNPLLPEGWGINSSYWFAAGQSQHSNFLIPV